MKGRTALRQEAQAGSGKVPLGDHNCGGNLEAKGGDAWASKMSNRKDVEHCNKVEDYFSHEEASCVPTTLMGLSTNRGPSANVGH